MMGRLYADYRYEKENRTIRLLKVEYFDVVQTLTCGQCFRYEEIEEGTFIMVAFGRKLFVKQEQEDVLLYPTTEQEFLDIWVDYFDLKRDYSKIIRELSNQEGWEEILREGRGIRLLNQQPWEALLSFIISQNNHIPRIKGIVASLCKQFGGEIEEGVYAFPTPQQLADVTEEMYRERCKAGFRGKYMADCVAKILDGDVVLENRALSDIHLRGELMKIYGVGRKVADCVLVFAYGRNVVFPVDVWIKRMMEYVFFQGKEVSIRTIHEKAEEAFGENTRFAQQYLFVYGRNHEEIFKK